MLSLKKYMSAVVLASLCVSGTVYGESNSVSKASFAQSLDALQTGSNKISINLTGNVTREDAAVLIVEALGYSSIAKKYAANTAFKDVTNHKGEINLVKSLGIMSGESSTNFNPTAYITSAESQVILNRLKAKIDAPIQWNHICYAISSSKQMNLLKNYNAVSFGWTNLTYDAGKFTVNTATGDFKIPEGFEGAVDEAKKNGLETYLMVYYNNAGGRSIELLNNAANRQSIINELVNLCCSLSRNGQTRSFDGITIDFEEFSNESLKASYVTFLKELKSALKAKGKKLNVAVQPTTYYKGYDYKGIGEAADHVIIMAHDYGAKVLNAQEQASGIVMTPLTPISNVYDTLQEAVNKISDTSKIALQMNYSSTQWQIQQGVVLNSTAYIPDYTQIQKRLHTAGTIVNFDEVSQNPYATYENGGIKNVIWYENQRSLEAKTDLAKLLGIQNVSYWRLGLIPE